jgi:hypothetical protein
VKKRRPPEGRLVDAGARATGAKGVGYEVRERLPGGVADDAAAGHLVGIPGRRAPRFTAVLLVTLGCAKITSNLESPAHVPGS